MPVGVLFCASRHLQGREHTHIVIEPDRLVSVKDAFLKLVQSEKGQSAKK
jgi:hypothetical protein